jgi:hypothetical protein
VLLQLSRKSADSPQVRGSETLVDEPPIEPVQQNADVGCGHASVARDDDERAVARGDGFGYAKVGVASESAKPGHLGTDRVGRMNPRSIDAQQIRPVIRVNSEGRVLFVALERQWCIVETVARQGRSPDAAKPQKLPAPAQRCEGVHADDAIDVFIRPEDAQRALQDCLRDDPDWRGLLRVEEIDFSATSECANQGFHN